MTLTGTTVAETYFAKAREGKLFVHLLVDIIDLRDEFQPTDVEMTQPMLLARTRVTQTRDLGFLTKEG